MEWINWLLHCKNPLLNGNQRSQPRRRYHPATEIRPAIGHLYGSSDNPSDHLAMLQAGFPAAHAGLSVPMHRVYITASVSPSSLTPEKTNELHGNVGHRKDPRPGDSRMIQSWNITLSKPDNIIKEQINYQRTRGDYHWIAGTETKKAQAIDLLELFESVAGVRFGRSLTIHAALKTG